MIDIDFKKGKIKYNEFHVNFDIPFFEQLDSLTEDLLQIEYAGNYLLDIGWYPEYDANGYFTIQLIKDKNWDNPQYIKNCRTKKDLLKSIQNAIELT